MNRYMALIIIVVTVAMLAILVFQYSRSISPPSTPSPSTPPLSTQTTTTPENSIRVLNYSLVVQALKKN